MIVKHLLQHSIIVDVTPCPELEGIPNGYIAYVPDRDPKYFFGHTATYMCNLGFGLTASLAKSCVADLDTFIASWNSTEVTSCVGELCTSSYNSTSHLRNYYCIQYTGIMCEALPDISNGSISYATVPNPNFVFGTIATYTCKGGFGLRGGDMNRVCLGDGAKSSGEWSGSTPTCERMYLVIVKALVGGLHGL